MMKLTGSRAAMPPFDPSDPVTIGYVGAWVAGATLVANLLVSPFSKERRDRLAPLVHVATVLGGLNGVVIWLRALLGDLEQAGTFMPKETDFLVFMLGPGGLIGVAALGAGLGRRWITPRDERIDPARWQVLGTGFGCAVAASLWFVFPDLHSG